MALYSKECFAVMSNDSDFLIFPELSRYIPFESLNYKANGKIECHMYTPKRTAECLGINLNLLPLFSCMIGNDYTTKQLTDHYFMFLMREREQNKKKKQFLNIPHNNTKNKGKK